MWSCLIKILNSPDRIGNQAVITIYQQGFEASLKEIGNLECYAST